MFKRGHDYVMEMDVEVNYTPVEAAASQLSMTLEQAREAGLESLVRLVSQAAKEAVREAGQKWKGDQSDNEGEWPRFSVRFNGDTEKATAAYGLWGAKVMALQGTNRILRASLKGTDGTNLQHMDEALQLEYAETEALLSPDDLARIDALMDPDK